jgi:hypothetical protein
MQKTPFSPDWAQFISEQLEEDENNARVQSFIGLLQGGRLFPTETAETNIMRKLGLGDISMLLLALPQSEI